MVMEGDEPVVIIMSHTWARLSDGTSNVIVAVSTIPDITVTTSGFTDIVDEETTVSSLIPSLGITPTPESLLKYVTSFGRLAEPADP